MYIVHKLTRNIQLLQKAFCHERLLFLGIYRRSNRGAKRQNTP